MDTGIKEFRITDEELNTCRPSERFMDYVAEQKDKEPTNFMVGTVKEGKSYVVNDNSKEPKGPGNSTTSLSAITTVLVGWLTALQSHDHEGEHLGMPPPWPCP
jgi:hypothetical protein